MPLTIQNINKAIEIELTKSDELISCDPKNDTQKTRKSNALKRSAIALDTLEMAQGNLSNSRRKVCPDAPKR